MPRVLIRVLVLACLAVLVDVGPAAARVPADTTPVAARDLPRGAVLTPADIRYPSGARSDSAVLVGWVTRRVIRAGEALVPPSVTPPDVIEAGQAVQAVWTDGPIEMRIVGRAMGAAAIGERVMIRVDTKRRFEGTVVSPFIIRIDSPDRSR